MIVCPAAQVASMNGVVVHAQAPLAFAREADAVIVGSGVKTRELVLAKLGLLNGVPACTDTTTRPWVKEAGIEVLNQPFVAHGDVATAGGCLGSHYLAAWTIARLAGWKAAEAVVHYVAPVGQKEEYVERARATLGPYL